MQTINMHWAFRPSPRANPFAFKPTPPGTHGPLSPLQQLIPSPPFLRSPFPVPRPAPFTGNGALVPPGIFPGPGMRSPQQCFPLKGLMWPPNHSAGLSPRSSESGKDSEHSSAKRKYRRRKMPCSDSDDRAVRRDKCASPDSASPTSNGQKRVYSCTDCQYVTDRKNNLKRHVATMHEQCTKLLECCDEVFANKAMLREHVRRCHRHGYDCRVCGRTFCRKALLKRHVTVHSGQKDFVCGLCGYATSHKSNLDRHKRRHLPKHLRKPPFFPSGDMSPFSGSFSGMAARPPPSSDAVRKPVHSGAGMPLQSLMSAFYHQRPIRFGAGYKLSSAFKPRTPMHVRDSLMVKRKYSAFRKLMLLRCAARDPGTASSGHASAERSSSSSDTDSEPTTVADSDDGEAARAPRPSRLRLVPSLHRCTRCSQVCSSQLVLNDHLADHHPSEDVHEPLRPLTLQQRPKVKADD